MWVETAIYTLLGFVVGFISLGVWKRLSGMNEFSKIKSSLSSFVAKDKRIHLLFPPPFVSSEPSGLTRKPVTTRSWLEASAGGIVEVKAGIEKRIERAAIECPEFAEALRYAFVKSGKMIRSRIVILLGISMDIVDDWNRIILLAQAVELLHCASLLHDDVVDEADMRRGVESHRKKFGDRTAILTGDNLISILVDVLTDIGNIEVTETVSHSIEALVIGELLQLTNGSNSSLSLDPRLYQFREMNLSKQTRDLVMIYLRKSYFKTASLFACLCQCVGFIGGRGKTETDKLGSFGFFFGLAFQLIDDILDLEVDDEDGLIGKPVGGSDIRNGTITLPVILASESDRLSSTEQVELRKMIKRRFKLGGDPERAMALISKSDAIEQTRKIVSYYFDRCRDDVSSLIGSSKLEALEALLVEYESRRC
jgi:all-trans-nonaprenyl-diphosphate synthase